MRKSISFFQPLCSLLTALLIAAPATAQNAAVVTAAPRSVFPATQWKQATPASQGVDPDKLEAAIALLARTVGKDGVGELVMIRNGRMIWHGDQIEKRHGIWSATKSFTSTILGLLIEDGKCTLDTRLADILPEMKPHYGDVTLRHLTTMTSGYRAVGDTTTSTYKHGPSNTPFEPNPIPLFKPPGSQYAYWDSAMNALGLALTKCAGEPIENLFRRRIADPVGMKKWDWGDYTTVDGVVVNGGSGNSGKHMFVTASDLARFGLLFLHRGNWNSRQLISEQWIDQATSVQVPASLPWAQPESEIDGRGVYGFNWWVNGIKPDGHRKLPAAPASTFFASGHNNNRCFVIPDWNMVIVRLGLDGKAPDQVWDAFLQQVGAAVTGPSPKQAAQPPYPQSRAIAGVQFDWSTHRREAQGSDNWPTTWANDGHLYSAWGDGGGFGGTNSKGRALLGVARIEGNATSHLGRNVWGGFAAENPAQFEGKSYGILSVAGVLYMWVSHQPNPHLDQCQLAFSKDSGATWRLADWSFHYADQLTVPTFLNFGRDYAGARDNYVYSYFIQPTWGPGRSPTGNYGFDVHQPGRIYLARVSKDAILDRNRYQFFAGFAKDKSPQWSGDLEDKQPVFEDSNGVGWNLSVSYNGGLRRYVLATEHTQTHAGQLGLFDAPEPWGPWTTVAYEHQWGEGHIEVSTFYWNFPTKWLSDDGVQFTLIFTGKNSNDSWNTIGGKFVLRVATE